MARINQSPAVQIDSRNLSTSLLAELAGIEAIFVVIDSIRIVAGRCKVLDPREAQAFSAEICKISLMKKAESTGESEIPAKAGPIPAIAKPPDFFRRSMPAVNALVGGQSP
jgi:hypothetical protein